MITEAVMRVLHGLAVSVFAWLSEHLPGAPDVWAEAADAVTTAFALIPGPVRYFLPIGPTVTAGLAMVGLVVALGGLRLARRVLSLFTGGGGMA